MNTPGIRFKTDYENISSTTHGILVSDDACVANNYRMCTFENVDIVVPFAVGPRKREWKNSIVSDQPAFGLCISFCVATETRLVSTRRDVTAAAETE